MSATPPVLFLVLDSMRTDRLGLYGHDRETTPVLDDLASGATVYENAVAPAAWTLPSHCSMFTGLFPSEHGVTNGFLDATGTLQVSAEPLAKTLAGGGFRTAGFSNNPWVGGLSGLDAGFEEFVEWNLEVSADSQAGIHTRRDRLYSRLHTLMGHAARQPVFLLKRRFFTASLVERAKRWFAAAGSRQFTFLNLMEAHSPYFPPARAFRELELSTPGVVEPRSLNTRLLAYVMGKTDLNPERRERVLEYYDASLRYQDRKVGELLEAFREAVEFEDALVVVCADHGKTLGEYDRDASPPHYLRDINITVPLVVKYPGQREGRRVADPVELTRLFDLVRDGGRNPLGSYTEPCSDGRRYGLVEEYVPHTGRESETVTRWRGLVGPDYKYLRSEDGRAQLVERTPPGRREYAVEEPETASRLAARLDERVGRLDPVESAEQSGSTDEGDLGGDVEAQLEDLGYL